jgi:hypothetical protein
MAQVQLTTGIIDGDRVTVTGTVDGKEYTVQCWKSHLDTLATKAQKAAYVAGLLKATATAADVSAKPTVDLSGSYTV